MTVLTVLGSWVLIICAFSENVRGSTGEKKVQVRSFDSAHKRISLALHPLKDNVNTDNGKKNGFVRRYSGLILAEEQCNMARTFPCVCETRLPGEFVVNCSNRNLTSVPNNIPSGATKLILSYNRLTDLPAGMFRNLVSLKLLDLSNNKISHLVSGAFQGLHGLKTLLLNNNVLNMSSVSYPDDVFEPLCNLTLLNLKTESVYLFDSQYPDVALSKLSSLQTLLINGLSNETFGTGVQNMTSLRTLDMSGTSTFTSISRDIFVNFRNICIQNLILSHCDLHWIHPEAFSNLPHIDTIDYSYNIHLEIKGVGVSTYGLQNSTIRKIVMQRVHAEPVLTLITKDDMQYLTNTNLEELHADDNTIGQLGKGVITALPVSLKVLRMSGNYIEAYGRQLMLLLRLKNAEVFDFSNQESAYNTNTDTVIKDRLRKPILPVRNVSIFGLNTPDSSSSSNDFRHKLNVLSSAQKGTILLRIPVPPKLWMLNCSRVHKIWHNIPAIEFVNSSLRVVKFAENVLKKWIGPVKGTESVRLLDLTANDCDYVSEIFFSYMTGLETLLIGRNRLGINKLSEKTFYNLTRLQHLDMNNNRLKTVGQNLFSRLTKLTYVNFSRNDISEWKASISGLINLKQLDLAYNSLYAFPLSLCQDLDTLQKSSAVLVDITGNPFRCTCGQEYFVEWLTQTSVRLGNLNTTFCTLANGTVLPLAASRSILAHLHRDCPSYAVLIGVLCACLAVFLIILLVGMIHRHRWKLRYLYYMAANWRERTGYLTLDDTEEKAFAYDAFVSYEDTHLTFIREKVIPRLETEAGLKLCIDKRDFIPGHYISDNIFHAIQNSKKTVVFLSRKFLKSKWCMHELNMVRMEGIYNGREVLIVVLTEEIPAIELTPELVEIFYKQTFFEMTNDRYGEAIFWESLVRAIQSD